MKKKLALLFLMLSAISSAHAAITTWTKATTHYTIYSSGGYAAMPFAPPSSVPSSGVVSTVQYSWFPYANGNTLESVELCYSAPYSSVIGNCQNISGTRTGTSFNFAGKSAKGEFWIRHTIFGGTYPTVSTTTDSITETYVF